MKVFYLLFIYRFSLFKYFHIFSYVTKIYGPTCDTLDCIVPEDNLPELDVGDWLVWVDMGAYTNASRSDFNGITRPMSYYYISNEDQKIIDSMKKKPLELISMERHEALN